MNDFDPHAPFDLSNMESARLYLRGQGHSVAYIDDLMAFLVAQDAIDKAIEYVRSAKELGYTPTELHAVVAACNVDKFR